MLVTAIVIALTDLIMFYAIERNSTVVTLPLVISIIIITIIPIAVNVWYWLPKYKLKW
ncbi:hypothetical protein H0N96_03355 [Candidatus Micrarchaeota archaeon]|nr:hypothetical protein [Candidatus Micrarchaeota archaeon]